MLWQADHEDPFWQAMHLKSIVLLAIIFLAPLIHAGVLENLIDTLRLDRQPPRPLYPSSFQVDISSIPFNC